VAEIPVIEAKLVTAIRDLASRGYGIKAITREISVARRTVRRYLRQPVPTGFQIRPRARRLSEQWRRKARELFSTSGNAAAVQRSLIARGVPVSVWTVRRAVGDLRPAGIHKGGPHPADAPQFQPSSAERSQLEWEFQLLRQIARKLGGGDPDELESALTLHLARVRLRRSYVRDWKAYLWRALYRKGLDWLKDRRRDRENVTSFDQPVSIDAPELTLEARVSDRESAQADPAILRRIRRALDPWTRRICDALIQTRMNQTKAAELLGVHRNTIRNALRRIRKKSKTFES
jgi:RNA polymerase sigma factor (sigma-70 family)